MSEPQGKTALVVGAGGLGAPAALAIAAAGTRRLILVDDGAVAPADLVVQPLLAEADVGRPRADALARVFRRLHPDLAVTVEGRTLDAPAARALARTAQVVVEATSAFPAMFLWNDAAAVERVPLVHGAVLGHTAQLLTVMPGATGCLRCLFEGPPPRPARPPPEPDPLGPLAGLAGSLLGQEAVRLLEDRPAIQAGQLAVYEARTGWSRTVPVRPRPACPACGGSAPEGAGG